MRRGEVWRVTFAGSSGGEVQKIPRCYANRSRMNEQRPDVPQRGAEPLGTGQVAFDHFDLTREVARDRATDNGTHLLPSLDEMLDKRAPDGARWAGDNNHDNFLPWGRRSLPG